MIVKIKNNDKEAAEAWNKFVKSHPDGFEIGSDIDFNKKGLMFRLPKGPITFNEFKSIFEYIEDEGIAIKLNDDELRTEFLRFLDKRPSCIPEDEYSNKGPKIHTIFRCFIRNKHKPSEKGYYTDKSSDYYYDRYCLVCGKGLGLPSLARCHSPNVDLTTFPPSGGSGLIEGPWKTPKFSEEWCKCSTHKKADKKVGYCSRCKRVIND